MLSWAFNVLTSSEEAAFYLILVSTWSISQRTWYVYIYMCVYVCARVHAQVHIGTHRCTDLYGGVRRAWGKGVCSVILSSFTFTWLSINQLLPLRLFPTSSAKMDSASIQNCFEIPHCCYLPLLCSYSEHAEKALKVVGFENHPISPSFWEGRGRISFKSSLCSTSCKGHAS